MEERKYLGVQISAPEVAGGSFGSRKNGEKSRRNRAYCPVQVFFANSAKFLAKISPKLSQFPKKLLLISLKFRQKFRQNNWANVDTGGGPDTRLHIEHSEADRRQI